MKLLQYFMAFLVFLAGFAIMDGNANGMFKHNELMGLFSSLLFASSIAIIFL